jgi:hypothetical protein
VALTIPVGVCAPVAVAAGESSGNAFGELTKGGEEATSTGTTASTTTKEPSTSTSTSSSGTVLLLGLIAAGALIAGIAFVILRDARRVAPVPDGRVSGAGRPARDTAAMMRQRRAKAKAARRQRKRNR